MSCDKLAYAAARVGAPDASSMAVLSAARLLATPASAGGRPRHAAIHSMLRMVMMGGVVVRMAPLLVVVVASMVEPTPSAAAALEVAVEAEAEAVVVGALLGERSADRLLVVGVVVAAEALAAVEAVAGRASPLSSLRR